MAQTVKERLAHARGLRQRGEHAAAQELYAAISKDNPGFADIQNELGLLLHELGDFERAGQAFKRALDINPRYTEAALHLAITWNDLGRYDEARVVFERAVQNSREGRPAVDPLVAAKIANLYADIGDAFQSAGNAARAANAYRDGLELGPMFHDIRVRLAQALQDSGDVKGAIRELEQVVDKSPEMLSARVALGLALLSSGEKEKAVAIWRDVLAKVPDHKHAARYLRLAGNEP